MQQIIKATGLLEMTQICAELVRQGLTFETFKGFDDETWIIKCTGGY